MNRNELSVLAKDIYLDFFEDFYSSLIKANEAGIKKGLSLVNPHELLKCVNDEDESMCVSDNYVQLNSEFNGSSNFYMNPFLLCLATNKLDSLRILLENGTPLRELPARIIEKNKGLTLWEAVARSKRTAAEYKTCVDLFLNNGKDVNSLDCTGQAPLHLAVNTNNKKLVKTLLAQKKIDINCTDSHGFTPLLLAAKDGCVNISLQLIWGGANPLYKDSSGKNSIDYTIEHITDLKGFKEIERKK